MTNYVLLEQVTLSANATSVTFSNIPQTGYTDLKVSISARSTSWGYSSNNLYMTFNGAPSGTSYGDISFYTVGTSTGSYGHSSANQPWTAATPSTDTPANNFGCVDIIIPNYTSANTKAFLTDGATTANSTTNGTVFTNLQTGWWNNTAAITSLVFTTDVTNFVAGSTFYLYGLSATGVTPAIYPKATGGDIIVNDGTYWYHAFLSSGLFTPTQTLSCDTLVVAGGGAAGGGGASSGGAGGGAGGLRLVTGLSYAVTPYTVAIGAGGSTGGTSSIGRGLNGNDSSINSYSATGGGGGGSISSTSSKATGANGGSGGGGAATAGVNYAGGTGNAGSYSPVEGYGGGTGNTDGSSYDNGAGGGGAGAVGANANSSKGGDGGVGAGGTGYTNYAILDAMGAATVTGQLVSSHYYYAGGGGGAGYAGVGKSPGVGGSGGGATAVVTNTTGNSATVNTGGGGGGGSTGGLGGSGIVIVRYAV